MVSFGKVTGSRVSEIQYLAGCDLLVHIFTLVVDQSVIWDIVGLVINGPVRLYLVQLEPTVFS